MAYSTDSSLPVQKIPLSKKDDTWRENCVDAIVARSSGVGSYLKNKMQINYDLYNGIFDKDDLRYVTNPYGVDVRKESFPANMTNINQVASKINLLLGEESKRPDNFRIKQSNPTSLSSLEKERKNALSQYIQNQIVGGVKPEIVKGEKPETPQEIEQRLRKYTDVGEKAADIILNYQYQKNELKNIFNDGWKDALIAGQEIYYIFNIDEDVIVERCNPLDCTWDMSRNMCNVQDGDWFLREMWMTAAQIYDRFKEVLTEPDLDKLLDIADESGGMQEKVGVQYSRQIFDNHYDVSSLHSNQIPLYHCVWRSYAKIGIIKYMDDGVEYEYLVDETYDVSPGEEIVWEWKPEIWHGYRVADSDLYFCVEPIDGDKLPYVGGSYTDTNSESVSLVSALKPLQYFYNIIWYRLELAVARDKGQVAIMDVTQIPKSAGFDLKRWMHYMSALGVMLVNPHEDGMGSDRNGKPASFNQFNSVDLSTAQSIQQYIKLLDYIDMLMGDVVGISRQREGQVYASELVGNVERIITQTSYITEPIFGRHNFIKKQVADQLLETTRIAWADVYEDKPVGYVMNDQEKRWLESVPDEFMFEDFDIFVTDSTKDLKNIEVLKNLSQAALQNGTPYSYIAEMLTSENMMEIATKLKTADVMMQQREDAQMQQKLQSQEKVKQAELQDKERDRQVDIQKTNVKANTDLKIAQLDKEEKIYDDSDEVKERIETKKVEADREKAKRELDLKEKELEQKKEERSSVKKDNND